MDELDYSFVFILLFFLCLMSLLSHVSQVARDATNGSETGKAMAYYVLDALLAVDHHQVFLSQLQSRGLLHSCLAEISSNSYQVRHGFSWRSLNLLQASEVFV